MRKLIKSFTGFSIIGVINTCIHTVIVIILVELFKIYPVYSNIAGFIIANIFSFWANCKWNFKFKASFERYIKFLIISLIGLTITIIISYITDKLNLYYLWGLFFIYVTLPITSFTMHYNWTFKNMNSKKKLEN